MQYVSNFYPHIVEYINKKIQESFGLDMKFIEQIIDTSHMGFFQIKYIYNPLDYQIVLENDRDLFTLSITDSEGATNMLNRMEKFDNILSEENIDKAIIILKERLMNDNVVLYVHREGKVYRKEGDRLVRIKDVHTL